MRGKIRGKRLKGTVVRMNDENAHKKPEYELRLVRSGIPLYGAAAAVLLYAVSPLPLIGISDYLICAAASAAVYVLLGRVFPPRQVRVALPHRVQSSGDAQTDKKIESAYATLRDIEASGMKAVSYSETFAADLAALTKTSRDILTYIEEHPDRISLVRRFIGSVLPMLAKLTSAYIEFAQSGTGEQTREEIERAVAGLKPDFESQLERLYADMELDISSDIAVLENLL